VDAVGRGLAGERIDAIAAARQARAPDAVGAEEIGDVRVARVAGKGPDGYREALAFLARRT